MSRIIFMERSQETKWSVKLSGRKNKNNNPYASSPGKERGIHSTWRYIVFTGAMPIS